LFAADGTGSSSDWHAASQPQWNDLQVAVTEYVSFLYNNCRIVEM